MTDKLFKKHLRDRLVDPTMSLNGSYENTGIIAPNKELSGNNQSVSSFSAYDAGDGAYVFATDTGIVFTKSSGVGTFVIPEGVQLISARVHGTSADLNSNTFSVVFQEHFLNESTGTLFPPTVIKYDRLLEGTPSEALPYTYDIDNTPQIQITNVNPLRIRVINLNGIVNWGLKIQM